LNDAGALRQADIGIAVSDHAARFTPASDAILDGGYLYKLSRFIRYARSGRQIITISFIVSILYNFVGLSFAVQGLLSPLVAAILMPASSISIIVLVSLLGSWMARINRLHQN
jgi:Cu+-exporting ATPase